MNILMLSPYVTLKGRPEFEKNQTGFGYMVYDIARSVAKIEKVDLLTSDSLGKTFIKDNIRFIKRTWCKFIVHFLRGLPLRSVVNIRRQYQMRFGTRLRLVYYWIISGYYSHVMQSGKYDIIHIHGCSFASELWIQLCEKLGQKYVVTLHGLNSFSETISLEPAGKQYERDFLKRATEGKIPITVISSGMKRIIERANGVDGCNNIIVVCNSYFFSEENNGLNIRQRYAIPQDAKVLLYVGNISKNKNQQQMVRAYELLSESLRKETYVLFCGSDHANDGDLQNLISRSQTPNHLILCGNVEKLDMACYYKEANGVVLLSFAEGFGLSLVEGMYFGLPCAMPKDLDAFDDIYNENAVLPIDNRTDIMVSKRIEELLTRHWVESNIREYSKKFNSSSMACNYINVYKKIIG